MQTHVGGGSDPVFLIRRQGMIKDILTYSNIAIVGGGRVCKAILEIVLGENFSGKGIRIVGVADINDEAETST